MVSNKLWFSGENLKNDSMLGNDAKLCCFKKTKIMFSPPTSGHAQYIIWRSWSWIWIKVDYFRINRIRKREVFHNADSCRSRPLWAVGGWWGIGGNIADTLYKQWPTTGHCGRALKNNRKMSRWHVTRFCSTQLWYWPTRDVKYRSICLFFPEVCSFFL